MKTRNELLDELRDAYTRNIKDLDEVRECDMQANIDLYMKNASSLFSDNKLVTAKREYNREIKKRAVDRANGKEVFDFWQSIEGVKLQNDLMSQRNENDIQIERLKDKLSDDIIKLTDEPYFTSLVFRENEIKIVNGLSDNSFMRDLQGISIKYNSEDISAGYGIYLYAMEAKYSYFEKGTNTQEAAKSMISRLSGYNKLTSALKTNDVIREFLDDMNLLIESTIKINKRLSAKKLVDICI